MQTTVDFFRIELFQNDALRDSYFENCQTMIKARFELAISYGCQATDPEQLSSTTADWTAFDKKLLIIIFEDAISRQPDDTQFYIGCIHIQNARV